MAPDLAPALGIIIPAIDEQARIGAALSSVEGHGQGVEVLVVDGGSRDGTVACARRQAAALATRGVRLRLLAAPRGRAEQMNAGAAASAAGAFLFLHADTLLPPG